MKGTSYSNSFAVHCPCDQKECEYDINNQEIDMENYGLSYQLKVFGNSKLTNYATITSITLNNDSVLELGYSYLFLSKTSHSIQTVIFNCLIILI